MKAGRACDWVREIGRVGICWARVGECGINWARVGECAMSMVRGGELAWQEWDTCSVGIGGKEAETVELIQNA